MKNKTLSVCDVTIAYTEKIADASKTIFFLHGNSQSSNAWRKQLNSSAFSDWRLVAFDLPAHGSSCFPGKQYCSVPKLAQLLSEAVKKLTDNKPYILASVSLATNIVVEMLAFDLYPAGIILAGPCIIGDNITLDEMMQPDTHVHVVFRDDAEEQDIKLYALETSASRSEEDIETFLKDYHSVQKGFRSLLGGSIQQGQFNDEINLLRKTNTPLLIIFGEDEKVIDPGYLDEIEIPLWQNQIFKIEGASHLVNIDEPEKFNVLAAKYAEEMFK
ncbi:MAG: alpha/beta fold hydrolase [Ilyomonas sp.]